MCVCVHVCVRASEQVVQSYYYAFFGKLYHFLLQAPPLAPLRPTMKLNSGASVPPHISRRKMSAPGNFTNHMVSATIKTEPTQGIYLL